MFFDHLVRGLDQERSVAGTLDSKECRDLSDRLLDLFRFDICWEFIPTGFGQVLIAGHRQRKEIL